MSELPTRSLGHSGLRVSILGLGGNNFGRRVDLAGTRAVVEAALEEGCTCFPLASGLLTGKYRRGEQAPPGTRLAGREPIATDEQFDLLAALTRFADERGVSLLKLALGTLLANPVVASVIAGATKPEQVRANAAAARWRPSDDDLSALNDLLGAAHR